jgi:NAD(P)-dependent dehydrogenase (short-subunit alcohol dehydrogenase family)
MNPSPLAGRRALVTGGSRGVGRDVARRLAAEGAEVAIAYRKDAEAAAEVVASIEATGGIARAYCAPVDDADATARMLDDLGPVDLLVSNAGIASRGLAIADTADEEYLRLLSVHVLGPLRLMRALLPQMRAARRGDIIVVSSATTSSFPPRSAPYTLAKAAMEAAARTLAREERPHGIRVNIVAPGLVATDMGERLVQATGGETIAEVERRYPFGRVGRGDDVAALVVFLASADGEYVTGQRIVVDGGGPEVTLTA